MNDETEIANILYDVVNFAFAQKFTIEQATKHFAKKLSKMNKFVDLSKSKYELENKFKIKIDYLEFRDEKKMKLDNFKSKYRLFIAYHINGVRLIDNF